MSADRWVGQAIELALANVAEGGRPFGALVIRDGEVIATGVNRALQDNDPTAHAELLALRAAAQAVGSPTLAGAIVVASGQPCPMCQAAAMLAGVERMLFAAEVEHAVAAGLGQLAVTVGEELKRPFDDRVLVPIVHVPHDDAQRPFEAWQLKQPG